MVSEQENSQGGLTEKPRPGENSSVEESAFAATPSLVVDNIGSENPVSPGSSVSTEMAGLPENSSSMDSVDSPEEVLSSDGSISPESAAPVAVPLTRVNTIATAALFLFLAVVVAVILGVLEIVKTTVLQDYSHPHRPPPSASVTPSATPDGTVSP